MAKKRKKEKLTLKDLEARILTLERYVVACIERDNGVIDHSVPMHRVDEDDDTGYRKIGFKQNDRL